MAPIRASSITDADAPEVMTDQTPSVEVDDVLLDVKSCGGRCNDWSDQQDEAGGYVCELSHTKSENTSIAATIMNVSIRRVPVALEYMPVAACSILSSR